MTFTGVILAGGAGLRMGGTDKAWLTLDDESFLLHLVRVMREAGASEVIVAAGTPERAAAYQPRLGNDARAVADPFPGEGPLSGIVAGLTAARAEMVAVAPVDAPRLRAEPVRELVRDLGRAPHVDLALPRWRGGVQPLNAVFRKHRCTAELADALSRGERMPRRAFETLRALTVEFPEDEVSFLDVDTEDDLARVRGKG